MKRRKVWLWTAIFLLTLGTILDTHSTSLFPNGYHDEATSATRALWASRGFMAFVVVKFGLLIAAIGSLFVIDWIRDQLSRIGGSKRSIDYLLYVTLSLQGLCALAGLHLIYLGVTNYLYTIYGIDWPVPTLPFF